MVLLVVFPVRLEYNAIKIVKLQIKLINYLIPRYTSTCKRHFALQLLQQFTGFFFVLVSKHMPTLFFRLLCDAVIGANNMEKVTSCIH